MCVPTPTFIGRAHLFGALLPKGLAQQKWYRTANTSDTYAVRWSSADPATVYRDGSAGRHDVQASTMS
jgi:hypothetical protein